MWQLQVKRIHASMWLQAISTLRHQLKSTIIQNFRSRWRKLKSNKKFWNEYKGNKANYNHNSNRKNKLRNREHTLLKVRIRKKIVFNLKNNLNLCFLQEKIRTKLNKSCITMRLPFKSMQELGSLEDILKSWKLMQKLMIKKFWWRN